MSISTHATRSTLGVVASTIVRFVNWASKTRSFVWMMELYGYSEKVILRLTGAQIRQITLSLESGSTGTATCNAYWIAQHISDIPASTGLPNSAATVVLLYFHGGGYCSETAWNGSVMHFNNIKAFNAASILYPESKELRLAVLTVDYALAPKSVWPSQLNTAVAAFKYLNQVHSTFNIKSLIVGGDSAGGHLAIHLLNTIASTTSLAALPLQPNASWFISPWVDPTISVTPFSIQVDLVSRKASENFSRWTFGNDDREIRDRDLYRMSPIKLPARNYIVYGGAEILAKAIELFIEQLKNDNDFVDGIDGLLIENHAGMPHIFPTLPPLPSLSASVKKARQTFIDHFFHSFEKNSVYGRLCSEMKSISTM
ncbi:hypothetical protein HK100_007117, partial [Physocladia obscura]